MTYYNYIYFKVLLLKKNTFQSTLHEVPLLDGFFNQVNNHLSPHTKFILIVKIYTNL